MKEMINSLIVDLSMLNISKLSVNELFTLVKIYFNYTQKQRLDYQYTKEDIDNLIKKNLIRKTLRNGIEIYTLKPSGEQIVIKSIELKDITNEEKNRLDPSDERVIDCLVEDIRHKFKGLKMGSMGDPNAVKKKLIKWLKENKAVSYETIIKAVDLYIESLNGNYNYVQRADYFIYKRNGGIDQSRLSSFIEEATKEPENSDWGSEIK